MIPLEVDTSMEIGDLLPATLRAVGAVLNALGIPEADVPDLVQDVLLVYLLKGATVHSPLLWLYQVARHRCLQYWDARRRAKEDPLVASTTAMGMSCESHGRAAALRIDCERSLKELPPRARSVVKLRYWDGFTAREIADRTGLAEGSVDKTARRSLSHIKRRLSAKH